MSKEIIWIAGGDGLVGKHLVSCLNINKYEIYILSRRPKVSNVSGIQYILWDPEKGTISAAHNPDHIVNLAGEGIAEARWTLRRKANLISSRVNSAKTIKSYLTSHSVRPKTYVSASAIGFYGHRDDEMLTEDSNPGKDFLSECCIQWEKAALDVGKFCEKTVILRIGIVLSSLGGALPKMLMTRSFGIFSYFGDGKQYHPWIHIRDLTRLIIECLEKPSYQGVYNAVAPQQISNKMMVAEMMKVNEFKGLLIPMPSFALNLIMGEMASILLNSMRISTMRLNETGFQFNFLNAGTAVYDVLTKKY